MAVKREIHIMLPELDRISWNDKPEQARLTVTTRKGDPGIWSSASVGFVRDRCVSCELFGDFHKTFLHDKKARATQAAIDRQHDSIFTAQALTDLRAQVLAFYAIKNAKDAAEKAGYAAAAAARKAA